MDGLEEIDVCVRPAVGERRVYGAKVEERRRAALGEEPVAQVTGARRDVLRAAVRAVARGRGIAVDGAGPDAGARRLFVSTVGSITSDETAEAVLVNDRADAVGIGGRLVSRYP